MNTTTYLINFVYETSIKGLKIEETIFSTRKLSLNTPENIESLIEEEIIPMISEKFPYEDEKTFKVIIRNIVRLNSL